MRTHMVSILFAATILSTYNYAFCDVVEYDEWEEWQTAVGSFTTIGFTDFPENTIITEQYADLGVHFLDGDDQVQEAYLYPNDGWGLRGFEQIHLLFDIPMSYIAADFPGFIKFSLFSEGELIYTSNMMGPGGVGCFGGLVSDVSFDEVIIVDPWDDYVFLDDLHFGPPIPSPPALALFAIGCFTFRRRRRRR